LPKDYDITLYGPGGAQIGVSQNAGTNNESITYNGGAAGTYKVQVYGYNGAYSAANCYTLKVTTTAACLEKQQKQPLIQRAG
jgi:hypothetical protein